MPQAALSRRRCIPVIRPRSSLDSLPEGYEELFSPTIKKIKAAARAVVKKLQDQTASNQYIVIRGLSDRTLGILTDESHVLGVPSRITFDKNEDIGIIKILPSVAHDATTMNITGEIRDSAIAMGVHKREMCWGGAATHEGNNKGKEPDQCFFPGARQPRDKKIIEWPTFVIETGMTESLPRLQDDARWWFCNSNGEVRIVLVVCISGGRAKKIIIEKWQLAPANSPNPMTRPQLEQLRQQNPSPPTTPQTPATQQPFSLQEILITPNGATGAPLVLPFEALFDRAPRGNERDIVIGEDALVHDCARHI